MTAITRNIGSNRGRPRVWIEGNLLLDNGFKHGVRWSITYEHFACTDGAMTALVIKADPDGKRKIAGTAKRPIIDIIGGAIELAFDCETVKTLEITVVEKGELRLLPAQKTGE